MECEIGFGVKLARLAPLYPTPPVHSTISLDVIAVSVTSLVVLVVSLSFVYMGGVKLARLAPLHPVRSVQGWGLGFRL